ncbi:NUDIX domain-containing protein [Pseudomonas aeruginosa]|uniref:NUDIX hydrolase n=1 Tax=Pseudomonas aeruginosa TaxID=287 RepID=UPI0009A2EC5C|nr:NUDIX domain-containing protein [Pseudomonas aeruginosa]MBH8910415.1 NUDIX domain-containing protein [Pseudomonas aeruginosa]MBI8706952.1 NUDIX domain-containing protein [Pseudomonas aeruginosa]MBK3752842.1 NUDIX domain-containing protein [Pseudomonas aeruginosa]MBK3763080.1 NUDIX domain-containing protein [Pseudomonas aeruginosa]MBK3769620.1 NUDIX domain-containing protein [Pseudomonas aeruginosa]
MKRNITRIGCGAAIIEGGKILLLKRRRTPESGHWGIPGGKVDWMEPVEHAVCREVQEETGLTLKDIKLIGIVDQLDKDKCEHWIAVVYIANAFTGAPRILEPEKHKEMGWFDLRDLPQPLTQATKNTLPALLNL